LSYGHYGYQKSGKFTKWIATPRGTRLGEFRIKAAASQFFLDDI